MNDRMGRNERDVLDRATAALRDARISDGPSLQLTASTVEALQTSNPAPSVIRRIQRRKLMFRVARYGAAAAAVILVVMAGAFWLLDRTASTTFADMVENVKRAKSVSFVAHQKFAIELETKVFIQGNLIRCEIPDALVLIADLNQRKVLELDPYRKVARWIDKKDRPDIEELKDPIEQLRNLKEDAKDHAKSLGDEEVGGRKCHVYQIKGLAKSSWIGGDQFTLWVDVKTGLPVKIHADDEHTSLTFEDFKWDEPLKTDLFSLEIPKGYTLEELTPAVVKPGRIYYQEGWVVLHSILPDGGKPEMQFVPRLPDSPEAYDSSKAELSPDGRDLAMAYSHVTSHGAFPPYHVLLWDRTQPKEAAVEVYARPEGELQSWRFSDDGKLLYVSWWEHIAGKKPTDGRYGTDVVDLKTKAKQAVKLPTYKDADGKEQETRFAAASVDGQTILVVGQGLQAATADGKVVRSLTAPDANVLPASVRLSPDGKQVVYATFHRDDKSHSLSVVSLAGGEPKELIPAGKFTDVRLRWSPDGKRVAYTCRLLDPKNPPFNYGAETYLKLVDADGGNASTLLTKKVQPKEASLELTAWR
jgi:outer membrane lipoprotein-sorting protein